MKFKRWTLLYILFIAIPFLLDFLIYGGGEIEWKQWRWMSILVLASLVGFKYYFPSKLNWGLRIPIVICFALIHGFSFLTSLVTYGLLIDTSTGDYSGFVVILIALYGSVLTAVVSLIAQFVKLLKIAVPTVMSEQDRVDRRYEIKWFQIGYILIPCTSVASVIFLNATSSLNELDEMISNIIWSVMSIGALSCLISLILAIVNSVKRRKFSSLIIWNPILLLFPFIVELIVDALYAGNYL